MSDHIDSEIEKIFWSDYEPKENFPDKRPLLAHYTSLNTLEKMMLNDELWLSNPLNMNDIEELTFGINQGAYAFRNNKNLNAACGNDENYRFLISHFDKFYQDYDEKHVFDTYVMCFSEYDLDRTDGLLSMWRGYGEDGAGAAVVFDTSKLTVAEGSPPFLLAKVEYGTREKRLSWINQKILEISKWLESQQVTEDILFKVAWYFFERIKLFAIFTKHDGFREEREWRYVYLKDRDKDEESIYKAMLSYFISESGIQPKLKLKISEIEDNVSLEELVSTIVLGPASSSILQKQTVERMLEQSGKACLIERLNPSSIPYRP